MSVTFVKEQNKLLKNIGINPKRGEYAGIELLRFILALIVITHHFFWTRYSHGSTSNLGTLTPVACFAIISGFFSAKNLNFKKQAIKSLYLILYLLVCIFLIYVISLITYILASNSYIKDEAYNILVFKSGLSTTMSFSQWWFLTALIPLCLFSPAIGKFMLNLNKYFVLFFILAFIFLLNTSFFMPKIIWNFSNFNLTGIFTIMLGFMLGIWIKLNVNVHSKKLLIFSLIAFVPLCVVLFVLRIYVIIPDMNLTTNAAYTALFIVKFFTHLLSPSFGILDALLCFCVIIIFLNIKIKSEVIVTMFLWLGQMAFIIYLYHEFFDFVFNAEYIRHMQIDNTIPYWDPNGFTASQAGHYFAFIGITVGLCLILMPLTNILTKTLHTWALSSSRKDEGTPPIVIAE